MKFIDEAAIYVRSGRGGDGCISFLRERYRPKGGPDGGDGGKGGDVIFVADRNVGTLLSFRFNQHYRAEHGQGGMGRQKYGRKGQNLVVKLPIGTVVSDHETGEILADLDHEGARVLAAAGGRGGRGNMHYASSTNQTPRERELGEPAIERRLRLTLKLLADVGLVGFPNAGKSTLISRISAARPKIADYPFTTLVPQLGLVQSGDDKSFVVADIPGLIEGASEGAGLGHRFLRHVERVSRLCILVTASPEPERDPLSDYHSLIRELEAYAPELKDKPRSLVLSKADLPDATALQTELEALAKAEDLPFFVISSVTGEGISALVFHLQAAVDADKARQAEAEAQSAAQARAPVAAKGGFLDRLSPLSDADDDR